MASDKPVSRPFELMLTMEVRLGICCTFENTLFDGAVYLPELSGSRDTCVFEADEEEGVYTAELDVDMLRYYRRCEVWGFKNRRPELYGEISDKSYG